MMVLPDEVSRDLGLHPGDIVSIERDGEALMLTRHPASDALARLREAFKGYSVDQFIAERHEDWSE